MIGLIGDITTKVVRLLRITVAVLTMNSLAE